MHSSSNPECWLMVWPLTTDTMADRCRTYEAEGWDGIGLGDTQCLSEDPFLLMMLGFQATSTLKIMPAVANIFTRHVSVMANQSAVLQRYSHGRMVLGLGRGDSSFSHLGVAPGTFEHYERSIRRLQGYLSGEVTPFDPKDIRDGSAPISKISLGQVPEGSELKWLDPSVPKVPIDIHTGGPRTLKMAARYAERITLIVGASLDRIKWALDIIEQECDACGRDPREIEIGVVLSVVPYPDRAYARELGAGHQASMIRAAAIMGHCTGPYSDDDRREVENMIAHYDMNNHCAPHTSQIGQLSPAFIDRHFVVGPAEECVAQLREILALGVQRLFIATSSTLDALRGATAQEIEDSKVVHHLLAHEVVGKLKQPDLVPA